MLHKNCFVKHVIGGKIEEGRDRSEGKTRRKR